MTGKTLTHKSAWHRVRAFFGIILIFSGVLVSLTLQSVPVFAEMQIHNVAQDNCPAGAKPDSNSILVVLLDRSGSLVPGNGVVTPTDPALYSSSVTKALADLWPGQIAVIPFGKQVLTLGPYSHANGNDITSLKTYIDNNPPDPNASTPLRAAMDDAKAVFGNGNTIPSCSKIVLITDGVPDAPSNEQSEIHLIETGEVPWFRAHALPINVFGLQTSGTDADSFLTFVENGTGAGHTYNRVQSATDLATSVIGLYSGWDGLTFDSVTENQTYKDYPVPIDPFIDQATIISFFDASVRLQPLTKNGQAVPQGSVDSTSDRHYEIDSIINPATASGIYAISAQGDAPVQVFKLVHSNLVLNITSPTPNSVFNTGQSITIKAQFVNSDTGTPVVTNSSSPLLATVTFSPYNQSEQSKTVQVPLNASPGSNIFQGSYLVPATNQKEGKTAVEIGNISIKVQGQIAYQGISISRDTLTTTIRVDVPKAPPAPPLPPPPPCRAGPVQCFLIQYHTQILIAIPSILVLLLVLFLLWWILSNPFAGSVRKIEAVAPAKKESPIPSYSPYPQDKEDVVTVRLGENRAIVNKLLHRRVISSVELYKTSKNQLFFDGASFQLIAGRASQTGSGDGKARRGKQQVVFIKPTSSAVPMTLKKVEQIMSVPPERKTSTYGGDTGIAMKSGPSTVEELSLTTQTPLTRGDIVRIAGQDNFQYM